ncbi:MAG TPA: SRPBCC family protein [Steroidobacteraceae bacterium]|nr:SRPBCC family protein [Steroidobacteraceae bacterium]
MNRKPRSQTGTFRLPAPLAVVMPLFTAEGERRWAKGWDPEILSGGEERGSAFRTRNDRGTVTTWIVVDFRPAEGRASYARLAEGSSIGLVDVRCVEAEAGGTDVTVTYTLTPLNADAESFVEAFLQPAAFATMMDEWAVAVAHALPQASRVTSVRQRT